MKTLYIVRHAKSSWSDVDLADIDRPLKERGVNDAIKIGERLRERNINPDIIFSSNAIRALHTAMIIARYLDFPFQRLMTRKEIYASTKESLFHFLSAIDNQNEKVMIVGHDPTLTNFLNHFLPNQQLDKIPTSSVVELQILAENWIELKKSTTKTISQILPKTMQTIKLK
jgi:phosphohistidine phosphatase